MFAAPRPTADVFAFGRWLLRDWQDHGLAKEPETFPKQPMLGKGKGFGNWLRLPGRHHTLPHWTRVYDLEQGAWLEGAQAIEYILSSPGATEPIPAEAQGAASEAPPAGPAGQPGQDAGASPERTGKAPQAAPTPSDLDWASEAIQHLGPAYRDDYDPWLKVGLALAGLGSDGLALWDDWSRQSPKYEEGCCAAKWHSFTPDHGLTLGSLYHWAKAAGWPGPQGRLRCSARSGDAVARPDPEAVLRRILADGHLIELLSEWGLEPRAEAGCIEITWGPGRAAVVTPYTGRCHDAFKTLEFFELAVRCGAYPDEGTAVTALAARFGVQADEQEGADGDEVPTEAVRRDADGFESRGGRLGRWKRVPKEGWDWTPLANFDARVVEEVAQTIGASERRVFLIRASRPRPTGGVEHREVEVDAGDFDALGWVTKQLGAAWSVGSGRTCKDQVREAIQRLSALDGIAQHVCYGHTGWVERDGEAYYLHAGGAIGAAGPAEGFRVELAKLPLYALPAPAEGDALRQAVRACLRILELGRADRPNAQGIAAVLAALPWRAVLRPCPFAVSFVGGSGSRKTTCGCLALQFFAPGHSYEVPPPASWAATAAQIEFLQHVAKDSLLLLDNFIADGPDQAREQAKAATVLNNQGDGRGRSRMRPDMTPMPELPPRGSVLSTGEDCVQRRSAQGRSLVVKFTPEGEAGSGQAGSIDLGTLTKLQAEAGLYAQAMAAHVRHLARDRAAALERLDALTAEYKARRRPRACRGTPARPASSPTWRRGSGCSPSGPRPRRSAPSRPRRWPACSTPIGPGC